MAELLLEVVEGRGAGRQVPLASAVDIGRQADLPLALEDDQVSRRHARVRPEDDHAVVEDLGSLNGTFVNDQRVERPRRLSPGDHVRVGLTVLELRSQADVAARPSAVRPVPPITLAGVPEPARPAAPALRAEQRPPAYLPAHLAGDPSAEADYNALASLVDSRVKRQTAYAALATLVVAALALIIYFGAT